MILWMGNQNTSISMKYRRNGTTVSLVEGLKWPREVLVVCVVCRKSKQQPKVGLAEQQKQANIIYY